MDQLLCPKCHNVMSRYERNGVHVDHCGECGGLFLDRGELEHLIQAEATYYTPAAGAPQTRFVGAPHGYRPDRDPDRYEGRTRKRRSRGFLEDLLDF
jgi:Zn-finger nucleic acid-binding protein